MILAAALAWASPAVAQQARPAPAPAQPPAAAPSADPAASCFASADPASIVAGCDRVLAAAAGTYSADQSGLALQRRGGAKAALGRIEEALADFRRMATSGFRAHEANASIGSLEFRRQRLAEAETAYREALRINPSYALAQTGLGHTLLALNRPAEAVPHFDRALATADNDVSAHLGRAMALIATNDRAAARTSLDSVLRLDPRSVPALFLRAQLASSGGDIAAAFADADQAASIAEGAARVRALVFRGRLRISAKRYAEAIADCQKADGEGVALARADLALRAGAAYCVGLAHQSLGSYAAAEQSYSAALRIDPKDAAAHAARGYVVLQTGRYDAAIADLEAALRLDPRSQDAIRFLGLAYADKGDLPRAEAAFARAAAIDANDPWPVMIRAITLAKAEDRAKALAEQQRVLSLTGELSSDGHLVASAVQYFLGDIDKARAEVDRALALNAENGQAHRMLARLALRQGRPAESERAIATADRLLPGDPSVLLERGLLAISRKDFAAAVDALTRSLAINPAHAEAFAARGEAHEGLGRRAEAIADYEAAGTKLATDPDGRRAKARARERLAALAEPAGRPIEPESVAKSGPAPSKAPDQPRPATHAQNSRICSVVEGVFSHSRRYTGVEFDVGCSPGN